MFAEFVGKKECKEERKKDRTKEVCQRNENVVLCNLRLLCIIAGIK